MAYAHFEDIDEVVISNRVGSQPEELADFILGSVVQSHLIEIRKKKFQRLHSNPISRSNPELASLTQHESPAAAATSTEGEQASDFDLSDLSPIEVHSRALEILRSTIVLMERNQSALERGVEMAHLRTPEIMKRYGSTQRERDQASKNHQIDRRL
jgi:hypothetical protein